MKKLLAVAFMVPTMASAEFMTGNDLYIKMQSTSAGERIQALGYIQGVFDTGQSIRHCAPNNVGITAGQIRDLALNYLSSRPELRNLPADLLVTDAIRQVWPCANRNSKGA